MKKRYAFFCACALLCGTVTAGAAESDEQSAGDIPVVVAWETTEPYFKVTVPTSVSVTLGQYSAACEDMVIINDSTGAVCVKQVEIQNRDWKLDGYSSGTIPLRELDSRYLGIQMTMGEDEDAVVLETQSVTQSVTSQIWRAGENDAAEDSGGDGEDAGTAQESGNAAGQLWASGSGEVVIGENESLSIGCKVRATAVSKAISAEKPEEAAAIIFIIDWAK